MKRLGALAACLALLLPATSAWADLSKVDRSIGKEPGYSGNPEYCLMVFGPDARTKVWLVLDGDRLYVSRHADGNLTDPGDAIQAAKEDVQQTFKVGDVVASPDGKAHAQVLVLKFGGSLYVDATLDGRHQSAGNDANGALKFAPTPADAPVIHFGGPLTLRPDSSHLHRGDAKPLYVMIGTPGLGAGTFASLQYDTIPATAYPVAEGISSTARSGPKRTPVNPRK